MTTARRGPFAPLLRHHRVRAGLSQEALAERARVSARAISALERGGNTRPQLETVRRLATALELDPNGRAALLAAARPGRRPRHGTRRCQPRPRRCSVAMPSWRGWRHCSAIPPGDCSPSSAPAASARRAWLWNWRRRGAATSPTAPPSWTSRPSAIPTSCRRPSPTRSSCTRSAGNPCRIASRTRCGTGTSCCCSITSSRCWTPRRWWPTSCPPARAWMACRWPSSWRRRG